MGAIVARSSVDFGVFLGRFHRLATHALQKHCHKSVVDLSLVLGISVPSADPYDASSLSHGALRSPRVEVHNTRTKNKHDRSQGERPATVPTTSFLLRTFYNPPPAKRVGFFWFFTELWDNRVVGWASAHAACVHLGTHAWAEAHPTRHDFRPAWVPRRHAACLRKNHLRAPK